MPAIRTRTFALPLVGLGLVAGLTLPPVFGRMVEKAVEARVAALDSRPGLDVRLESYERGWFSSTARVAIAAAPGIALAGGLLPPPRTPLRALVAVDHGPVSFKGGFFFGFAKIAARPAEPENGAPSLPFRFEARADLDGALHFVGEVPSLERATPDGSLSFSGGRVFGTILRRHVTAQGRAESLQARDAHGAISLVGLTVAADNELGSQRLLPGHVSIEADRASLEPDGGDAIEVAHASLHSQLSVDPTGGRLLDGRLELTAESILSGQNRRITRLRLTTTASRLDEAALEAYTEAAALVQSGGASADAETQLQQAVERVLAAAPAVEISPLSFSFDGQPFDAEVSASTKPDALPDRGPLDLADTSLWYAVVQGRANVTAAKTLVHTFVAALARQRLERAMARGRTLPPGEIEPVAQAQAGLLLATLAARGLLEDTGNLYKTALRLEDGRLTVNGKSVPFLGR